MILSWVLLGLLGLSLGLAFAFLSSDHTLAFQEGLKMTDSIEVIKNGRP